MKRCLLLCVGLFIALSAAAQSYEKLWSKYEDAFDDDKPKTALSILQKIRRKAANEKNDGQLIRSMIFTLHVQEEISPDSLLPEVERLEAAMKKTKNPSSLVILQALLGRLYSMHDYDTLHFKRGVALLRKAMQDPALLARATTKDYQALFDIKEDSKYYNHDLLSVFMVDGAWKQAYRSTEARAKLRHQVIRYYRQQGNRNAALLATLDSIKAAPYPNDNALRSARYATLMRVKEEFRDLPLNVLTYIAIINAPTTDEYDRDLTPLINLAKEGLTRYGKSEFSGELSNFLIRKNRAFVTMSTEKEAFYPGEEIRLNIRSGNLKQAEVKVYRTNLTTDQLFRGKGREEFLKIVKTGQLLQTLTKPLRHDVSYTSYKDSLFFKLDEPGIYLLQLEDDIMPLYVSRVTSICLSAANGRAGVIAIDRKTGAPLRGGTLKTYSWNRDNDTYQLATTAKPDQTGYFFELPRREYGNYSYLTVGNDAFSPDLDYSSGYFSRTSKLRKQYEVRVYTDRGIYRPGQKVQFGLTAYTQNGDSIGVEAGLPFLFKLYDANGRIVDSLRLKSDELGAAGGTFTLPEVCLPGTFSIQAVYNKWRGGTSFHVEEYKRPTFEVKLDAPKEDYQIGDEVKFTGKATTYSGVPLRKSKVNYTVALNGYYSDQQKTTEGTTETDDEGNFSIAVKLLPPPHKNADEEDDDDIAYLEDEDCVVDSVVSGDEDVFMSDESGLDDDADEVQEAPINSLAMSTLTVSVSASIVAPDGETRSDQTYISAGTKRYRTEVSWPSIICKERLPEIRVHRLGYGNKISLASGRYIVRLDDGSKIGSKIVAQDTLYTEKAFKPAALAGLKSGKYIVETFVEGADTIYKHLLLFSTNDKKSPSNEMLWAYNATPGDKSRVDLYVGTGVRNATLYCLTSTPDTIIEKRYFALDSSIVHLPFAYKDAYGDGATFTVILYSDGKVESDFFKVERPQPDKRLLMRWSSFRDRLKPGQKEEWRLRVTRPDGRPVPSSVLATLYDASLDDISYFNLSKSVYFNRRSSYTSIYGPRNSIISLSWSADIDLKNEEDLSFSKWDEDLIDALEEVDLYRDDSYEPYYNPRRRIMLYSSRKSEISELSLEDSPMRAADSVHLESSEESSNALKEVVVRGFSVAKASSKKENSAAKPTNSVRKNFNETAFFHPALRTDAKGEVSLSFTLPESLTRWRFLSLAHDAEMDNGRMDTTIVAVKDFMLQSNLPRFVRQGDHAVLSATLRNLLPQRVKGVVRCSLTDARSGEIVRQYEVPFDFDKEMTITFPYDVTTKAPVLTVRMEAVGAKFSDGEQQYLPVLSDREEVTRTLPFSMTKAGTMTLALDSLWSKSPQAADKRLTVEISSNPTWYAASALPALFDNTGETAYQQAMRYYAVSLATYIANSHPEMQQLTKPEAQTNDWAAVLQRNPELKQVLIAETPWVNAAEQEATHAAAMALLFNPDAIDARKMSAIDKLEALRLPDGGWGWYGAKVSDVYETTNILYLLMRAKVMTGSDDADKMLEEGFNFLAEKVDTALHPKSAPLTKAWLQNYANETTTLRYLYLAHKLGIKPEANEKKLLKALKATYKGSMYQKALKILVMALYENKKVVARDLESLIQHTVEQPSLGRYFDTDRASDSWFMYKIPTQTAAIEALDMTRPATSDTLQAMRLWLLQSKRAQLWPNSRATVDALYALLRPNGESQTVQGFKPNPLYFTLKRGEEVLEVNAKSQQMGQETVGYDRQSFTDEKQLTADHIVLRKSGEGLAWGSVYVQYTLPLDEIRSASNGLSIARRWEIKKGEAWQPLADGSTVDAGATLRQVITISADRDLDFVSVKASRPAGLEPLTALSGYDWESGAYHAVRDASDEYFYRKFPKGKLTFTVEGRAMRIGTFRSGLVRAQSQYAPEYNAFAPSFTLTVK